MHRKWFLILVEEERTELRTNARRRFTPHLHLRQKLIFLNKTSYHVSWKWLHMEKEWESKSSEKFWKKKHIIENTRFSLIFPLLVKRFDVRRKGDENRFPKVRKRGLFLLHLTFSRFFLRKKSEKNIEKLSQTESLTQMVRTVKWETENWEGRGKKEEWKRRWKRKMEGSLFKKYQPSLWFTFITVSNSHIKMEGLNERSGTKRECFKNLPGVSRRCKEGCK